MRGYSWFHIHHKGKKLSFTALVGALSVLAQGFLCSTHSLAQRESEPLMKPTPTHTHTPRPTRTPTVTPTPTMTPTATPGCGGFSIFSGCFYAIGQHTSVPLDIGLPSVPVSCDDFCSTRGGSNPVGLSCAQCATLFKKLYTGPDFQCLDVNPTNYAIDIAYWKTVSPNDPPGFHAAYAASCSVLYMHNGKGGVQSLKFAPNQPHYDMKFGRIYRGGAVHWASYICNCKK
jgi:hypothetical protein